MATTYIHHNPLPTSLHQLHEILMTEWINITQDIFQHIVDAKSSQDCDPCKWWPMS